MPPVDVMKIWRDMPPKTFFTIDGEIFQKNSATTALHVSNPLIGPVQARAIKPYVPPEPPAPVKDPEIFETKVVERPAPDPNYGATTVTVTPADSVVEQGVQPPPNTGRRVKKSKKNESKEN